MKNYLIKLIVIFLLLFMSRIIPHPPNFTNLLALSFYVPILLGPRYLPALIISFIFTDLLIGYHYDTHWTWGSVLVIGLLARYFIESISLRLIGASLSALIFFIVTNFGVWLSGMYGYTLKGLFNCFINAIPFFGNSLISTIIFSLLIEAGIKLFNFKLSKI